MDQGKPKTPPPPGAGRRGVELGLDRVARREERKLRRARELVAKTGDAFEHPADKPEVEAHDEVDRGAERACQSLHLTGHATPEGLPPVLSPLGLPLRPSDPGSVEARLPQPARSLTVPAAETVIAAAHERLQHHGRAYAVASPWLCPHPRVLGNLQPDRRPLAEAVGQFKDVYLCLDVLYLAGYEVPLVPVPGVPDVAWYPSGAELIAQVQGTRRTLHVVGQQKLQGVPHRQRRLRVGKAVREAQTGDLLVGQYRDDDGAPYGMVWLVLHNRLVDEAGLEALGCDERGALIALYPVDHFIYAEHVLVLRPVRALGRNDNDGGLAPPPKLFG